MKTQLVLLFIFVMAQLTTLGDEPIINLLPDQKNNGEWLPAGPSEQYKTEELYYLINGGADLYLEYGFKEVLAQSYENNEGDKISLEIYDMGSDSAAYGIFTMNYIAKGKEVNIGQLSLKSDYSLSFWKGNYFVLLRSGKVNDKTSNGFCLLAEQTANKIMKTGNLPNLAESYSPVKDIRYFMGTLGLASVYYFDYNNIFHINHGVALVKSDSLIIQLQYPDCLSAEKAFQNGISFMTEKDKFELKKKDENQYHFVDKKGKKLYLFRDEDDIHIQIL